jgi:hypothetical protein
VLKNSRITEPETGNGNLSYESTRKKQRGDQRHHYDLIPDVTDKTALNPAGTIPALSLALRQKNYQQNYFV